MIKIIPKTKTLIDVSRKILNVDNVHKSGIEGQGITVAYIDTGINPHLDFVLGKDRIVEFYDVANQIQMRYDDNGHGTFVAGIGSGNGLVSNGKYKGIAPKSNIVMVKALEKDGEAGVENILLAIKWVKANAQKHRIKVVCMSFGSEPLAYGDPIMKGAESLVDVGICVVAAAGNSGPEYQTIKSPGTSAKIITVGGLDDKRSTNGGYYQDGFDVADFSSRGPAFKIIKPDIIAPGVDIVSCDSKGGYQSLNGTSVAAPMIAGLCALYLQKYPNTTPFQIKRRLLLSALPITHNKLFEGYGLPNAETFIFGR